MPEYIERKLLMKKLQEYYGCSLGSCYGCPVTECEEGRIAASIPRADVIQRTEAINQIFADVEAARKKCFEECFKWYGNTDERREMLNYDAKLQIAFDKLKKTYGG